MSAFHADDWGSNPHSSILKMENELLFGQDDLNEWVYTINFEKHYKTIKEHEKFAHFFWDATNGIINSETLFNYVKITATHYSESKWNKLQRFAINFLKYLSSKYSKPEYELKINLLNFPKKAKIRTLTSWIWNDKDITNLLMAIQNDNRLTDDKKSNYSLFSLFLAYTGLRVETAAKLSSHHFKGIYDSKPCIKINHEIEKNSMERYIPIHPILVPPLLKVIKYGENDPIFKSTHLSFQRWLKNNPIMLKEAHEQKIELKGIRKYTEQKNDYLSLSPALSQYILGHGMSGVEWDSYKNYPSSKIYDEYISKWGKVDLRLKDKPAPESEYEKRKIRAYLKEECPWVIENMEIDEMVKSHYETLDEIAQLEEEDQLKRYKEWSKEYDRKNSN